MDDGLRREVRLLLHHALRLQGIRQGQEQQGRNNRHKKSWVWTLGLLYRSWVWILGHLYRSWVWALGHLSWSWVWKNWTIFINPGYVHWAIFINPGSVHWAIFTGHILGLYTGPSLLATSWVWTLGHLYWPNPGSKNWAGFHVLVPIQYITLKIIGNTKKTTK